MTKEEEFIKEVGFEQKETSFKCGDILISSGRPFIFDGTSDEYGLGCYCGIACDGKLRSGIPYMWTNPRKKEIRLATEEERKSFIQLLKDQGYSYEDIVNNCWYYLES